MPDLLTAPLTTAPALRRMAQRAIGAALLALGLAAQAGAQAEDIVTRHFDATAFADVREALAEAIAEQGIAQPVVSHFADMLDRTAVDLGHPRGLYAQAEILTFCSAGVAARLAVEAREHIALCPLSIAVYAPADGRPGAVIAYRPPRLDGAGGEAARALLRRIVARSAALLGLE